MAGEGGALFLFCTLALTALGISRAEEGHTESSSGRPRALRV